MRVCVYMLTCMLVGCVGLSGKVTISVGWHGHEPWYNKHYTFYLGSNEKALIYDQYAPGAKVDDGFFVAVPQGDGVYEYYEMLHHRAGGRDGGPAYLPKDPSALPKDSEGLIVSHYMKAKYPSFASWGMRGLPNGTLLPIGCKFFFWVSGGGWCNLGNYVIQQDENSEAVVIQSYAVAKPGMEQFYEESDVVELVLTKMKK